MTFDEVLAALLALVGERVDVHVFDASSTPHLVATFGGRLRAGYSMSGGDPAPNEAIYLRLEAGCSHAIDFPCGPRRRAPPVSAAARASGHDPHDPD